MKKLVKHPITGKTVIIEEFINTTAPVVNLVGDENTTVALGNPYNDAGATATDDQDGNLPVVVSGHVDTTRAGIYALTYTATDSGNPPLIGTATRTIEVVLPITLATSTGINVVSANESITIQERDL